ncbi:MAG TPA: Abi family protein [Longimicrobium sp.]|nr:Abi family protein [Longimicrobium sp.]
MPPAKKPYSKPALSPPALLAHLQQRGLLLPNPLDALHALEYIGYYRLLIYMRPLQKLDPATGTQRFTPGTTFGDVLDLYNFDRKLRLLCLDAIERIEVALRAAIVSEVAVAHGPHFFLDPRYFDRVSTLVEFYQAASRENKHLAIKHYSQRYSTPELPPVWAIMEAITYGSLSRLFSGLKLAHRKSIATRFGYDETLLVSWFRSVNLVRNMCAHHTRLWNSRMLVDQPLSVKSLAAEFTDRERFYARAIVMGALVEVIDPGSDWRKRLIALIDAYPKVPTAAMGFPANWRTRNFWR